jgi:hypothetical protein
VIELKSIKFVKNNNMTLIQLSIPDELGVMLKDVADDVNSFVTKAIRHELDRTYHATDEEIEASAIIDNSEDFLSSDELKYYLNLPNNV